MTTAKYLKSKYFRKVTLNILDPIAIALELLETVRHRHHTFLIKGHGHIDLLIGDIKIVKPPIIGEAFKSIDIVVIYR